MESRGAPPRPAQAAPEREFLGPFRCPVCHGSLAQNKHTYVCQKGHSFDIAAQGYVHLAPPSKKSRDPGDNAGMTAARTAFLESGAYAPLAEAICRALIPPRPARILDVGCGEGYYVRQLCRASSGASIYGIDLSRPGIRYAARRCREARFAVANSFDLPFINGAFGALYNIFSPMCPSELHRVLSPGGQLVAVYPAARHLFAMKRVLYDKPYENPETAFGLDGFSISGQKRLTFTMNLEPAGLHNLFAMTPYFYRTPPTGRERLDALGRLDVEADFWIIRYTPTRH